MRPWRRWSFTVKVYLEAPQRTHYALRVALTPDQVRHVAKLARLVLTDAEVERLAKDLTGIFTLIEQLQEVDTKNVEPTAQVTGLRNGLRPDIVKPSMATPDALLGTSPLPIREHQIETPSAHGN